MRSLLGAIWSWNWAIYMHWSPPHLTDRAIKYSRCLTFFDFGGFHSILDPTKIKVLLEGRIKVDSISLFLF